ncbi:disease resistance-like protein CSA1 [Neltuma alba]|uniref:disease resistance-like protein CSA1 n=1 Tax=Neltuma alba TaxID=207710 RepID=UPI0010A2F36C|nr:disease resistance-like protein CSA1 [Prosopis alba]
MSNLRLFLCTTLDNPFIFPSEWKFLAGALKVVMWQYSPLKALPLETQLNGLVEMDMSDSKIKQLWSNKQRMTKLKSIVLEDSINLTETPDFSGAPNLEDLRLGGCISLVKVHSSLGQLEKLVNVDMNECLSLEILPEKLETNSLVKLNLRECIKVAKLPEFGEGMKKLSYLNVDDTSITRLPESIGSLTGLEYLNLRGRKIENLSGWNVTSLTELYLSKCGLDDGSIPDFDSLSLLTVLDISFNDFENLPDLCGLSRLVFLSLDYCRRLKLLPRLPPRLIRLHAFGCDLMEPLSSDRQLWDLVASLDHECRGRTKYEIYNDGEEDWDEVVPSVLLKGAKWPSPLTDFCASLPGCEIPSWFPNKEHCHLDMWGRKYEIEVDMPPYFRDSEWCGIVVCFRMSGYGEGSCDFSWSSKAAPDDDHYAPKEWECDIPSSLYEKHCIIMVLELNEETCWRHLRARHNNSLHILFSFASRDQDYWEAEECGWRVIRKEEIQDWRHLNGFFNQANQPQLASSDEVKLPLRAFEEFFMGEYLTY